MLRINNPHLRKEYEEITNAKRRKLNSPIKDAEEDSHKIFQDEKKKKTKKETEKNDKTADKKKHESGNCKKNSNKKHKLKSGNFKFINFYTRDPY